MIQKLRPIVVAVIAAILLVAFLWWFQPWREGDVQPGHLYGNVDVRQLQLGFRASGRLATMNVEEGDSVAVGDVLASLDSQPAEEILAIADAELARALAQLASVRAGARPQEIEQARAAIRAAQAAFDDTERSAERQRKLLRSQSTSQTQADSARALRDSAAARLESANEALKLMQAGARQEDILAAEAAVQAAYARSAQAKTAVEDTVLSAPSAGVVQTRAREPGSMISSGQTVYGIALTDKVTVRAYVDEPMLDAVVPGTEVSINTDSGGQYTGQIGFVSPTAEFTPKTVQTPELRTDLVYRLRIIVLDADESLRQGMPVTVVLPESNRLP